MTRIFILLAITLSYGCQNSEIKEKVQPTVDTASVNIAKRDSIKRYFIFETIKHLRIAKYWKSTSDKYCSIDIGLDTEPMIYVEYNTSQNSENSNRFKSLKDYGDSLSITTQKFNVDTLVIWTFKPKGDSNGIWSKYIPQLNSYKVLGVFKPLDHYEQLN